MTAPIDFDRLWIREYPDLGTGPVSTEPCISAEYFEAERKRVFSKVWLKAARVEQLPNAGDYLVLDVAVCKASVILVRGNDGVIRAFHNVCMHRGNKLVWDHEKTGNLRSFSCRFHGWSFALDGSVRAVPDEKMFYSLDKDNCGLRPVAFDQWEGFLFINLDPQPKETLKEFLGDLGEHLSGYPYAEHSTCYSYRAELNANWKVCLDAFSEAYHVLMVHGQTVGQANFSRENPMSHCFDVQLYERHRRAVVYGNPKFQPSPTGKVAAQFGYTSTVRGRGMDTLPPQINPERRPEYNFNLCAIFPNFMIHVRPGEYFTHQFWPLDHNRTIWEGRNYLPPAKNAGERFSQEYSHTVRRNAWLEDTSAMEATHAGLSTGALREFQLSDPEILVRHGYKVLEDYVGFFRARTARAGAAR